MAIAMVALLAFGGTYAFFTAQANTLSSKSFSTGKVVLKTNEGFKYELADTNAVIVPGDKIISGGISYNNTSTVPTYVAVVVKMTVAGAPVTLENVNTAIIKLGVKTGWTPIYDADLQSIVYIYENAAAIDNNHDKWAVAATNGTSGNNLDFSGEVTFAAIEHTEDGKLSDNTVQGKQITLEITAYQTQVRKDNVTLKNEEVADVWEAMQTMLGTNLTA